MKEIELIFTVIAKIQVDDEDVDVDAAIEEVESAMRIALSKPVSLGAGAVELGAIVQNISVEQRE